METPRLDVTKEEWLAALESGNYDQTQNVLRSRYNQSKFCCLGVACEVSSNATRIGEEDYTVNDYPIGVVLHCTRPVWMTAGQEAACSYANDNLGWTFAQIAEWWRETDGAVKINNRPNYSFFED